MAYGRGMRRGLVLKVAGVLGLALCAGAACSKPPKTTVDVDTMREASFVKDIKDDDGPRPPPAKARKEEPPEDDTPVPAAPPAGKGGSLPEPEITSRKIDRSDAGKEKGAMKPAGKPSGREKITAAECSRMFDHFFDLVLESDDRFKDLGPDARAMVRQISAQDQRFQSMQKDCETDVSRTKFNCALAAKSQAAWQTCVK